MDIEAAFSDRGMVATSHPLAVEAGLDILRDDGTAADATVAAAAVLTVVDPRSTGVGGDAFALHWRPGEEKPEGLAAAGPAPAGLTVEALRRAGFDAMPSDGPWSITVPGSIAGWEALLSRHGRLGLGRVLERAIVIAYEGFSVSPIVAEEWADSVSKLEQHEAACSTFLPSGKAPLSGERFANPDLGRTLELLAERGSAYFYEEEMSDRIAAAVQAAGGVMRPQDLAGWSGPEWVDPMVGRYRDVDVFEMPPPTQGIVVLQAASLYTGLEPQDPVEEEHFAIESTKLAFADARARIADPLVEDVPVKALLNDDYLAARRGLINPSSALEAVPGSTSDTVYLAVADGEGRACSFIQSLYAGFGSGVLVPGTGVLLHNRGAGFVLGDGHPNRPAPGKRPYHTTIPAMLGRGGEFLASLGVVGAFMQPQGQFQILRSLIDRGLDPQRAIAAPRWRWLQECQVGFEAAFDAEIVGALEQLGHEISDLRRFDAGGGQIIMREGSRLLGGSDARKDGYARGL